MLMKIELSSPLINIPCFFQDVSGVVTVSPSKQPQQDDGKTATTSYKTGPAAPTTTITGRENEKPLAGILSNNNNNNNNHHHHNNSLLGKDSSGNNNNNNNNNTSAVAAITGNNAVTTLNNNLNKNSRQFSRGVDGSTLAKPSTKKTVIQV